MQSKMASPNFKKATGVTYDHCLESHYSLWNKDFTERPLRTKACINRCEELGLLSRCKRIPVREATLKEILTSHSQELFDTLSKTKGMNEEQLKELSRKYDYLYLHQDSMENARLALGATIDLVEEIVTDKISNGMAIVRPPGHHAMQDEFCGYCYFNNVAVAAQIMIEKHGLERIIIFDWDVHHGQGSQYLFYHDPRVLYVSIHRYEYGEEWPFLRESDYDFIGRDAGKGYNINIPLNEIKCGNDDFLSMFFNILLPIFSEFDPQLVLVSAGFDCAIGCPEGEMDVTPACFAHFVNMLTPLASGKMALILEGGYNIKSLSESVALSLRALLGDPTPSIQPISKPKRSVVESVLNAIKVLHPYWRSLSFQDLMPLKNLLAGDHPFPRVLHDPPVEGVKFYTAENHPNEFPLIQDCFGEAVMHNMDLLNQDIDLLIQNTLLLSFQYRLSILYDHTAQSNIIHSSLLQELKSTNLPDSCLPDRVRSDPYPSTRHCIHSAVNNIMSGKSQACLALVSSCPSRPHSEVIEECEDSTGIGSAIRHAFNTHNVDRILVIRMASIGSQCYTGLGDLKGVLQVTVSWPGVKQATSVAGPQELLPTDNDTSQHDGSEGRSVHIEFPKGPLTCGDFMAAFQHVILPVSYEFCPDFVIFTWERNAYSSIGLANELMGHITQYLHGLAFGRLLVLVDDMEDDTSESANVKEGGHVDQLLACASVLLGQQCAPLGPCVPSKSGIQAVRETLDEIKSHWSTITFQQQIPGLES